jgi:hypothetical protein
MDVNVMLSFFFYLGSSCLFFLQDYEVSALQPMLLLLPSRRKSVLQRYGSLIYAHLLYSQIMVQDIIKRIFMLYSGKAKARKENLLIFIQLGIFISLSSSLMVSLDFRSGNEWM